MIQQLNKKRVNQKIDILDFLSDNFNYDFYVTKDNIRYYINDNLNLFLNESEPVLFYENCGDVEGVLGVWRGFGKDKKRHYVKICAKNVHVAKGLLTVLLWNSEFKNLFVKIRKDSEFVGIFREKNFRFKGGRGVQLLLHRKNK